MGVRSLGWLWGLWEFVYICNGKDFFFTSAEHNPGSLRPVPGLILFRLVASRVSRLKAGPLNRIPGLLGLSPGLILFRIVAFSHSGIPIQPEWAEWGILNDAPAL